MISQMLQLTVMAAIGILATGIISFPAQYTSIYSTADQHFQAEVVRRKLIYLLDSRVSWAPTLAESMPGECNASLACVRNGTDCFLGDAAANTWSDTRQVLCLRDTNGRWFFDGRDANAGIDRYGRPCQSFNTDTPDNMCVFRPKLTFRSTCATAPCVRQPIEVKIEIQVSGPNSFDSRRLTVTRLIQ